MSAMDPFTMSTLLLGDVELTADQLAQLRAINTKYFTALAALKRKGGVGEQDMADLNTLIASDIRDMLTREQQAVFDRNLPRVQ